MIEFSESILGYIFSEEPDKSSKADFTAWHFLSGIISALSSFLYTILQSGKFLNI